MTKQITNILQVTLFLLLTFTFSLSTVSAQSPNAFSYQAVARASNGDLITEQAVSFRISILQGSASGTSVYSETHSATINKYGLVNLQIGNGTSGDDFTAINWANGPYFVKVEMDATGGTTYAEMGTSQLLSVPYAIQSGQADTAQTFNKLTIKGSEVCNAEKKGLMRYNSDNNSVKFCDGSTWHFLSVGSVSLSNVSSTVNAGDFAPTSFETGGTIVSDGGATIIERGVVYGNNANPIKSDSYVAAGSAGTGSFSVTLTGLSAAKVYYRAYAINAGGISYGPEYSINVYEAGTGVTDYDGNTYGSVIIGDHEWMTSNLAVTKYSDGTAIPLVTDNTALENLGDNNTDKVYCWYDNDDATNKDLYGALYTYAAATNGDNSGINVQGVCPTGWHLPSDAEWTALTDALGGASVAGDILKATSGWNSGSDGTDDIGFAALPGGYRSNGDGSFSLAGGYGIWWSSTEGNASDAWNRDLRYNDAEVNRYYYSKSFGFSVRCVRD